MPNTYRPRTQFDQNLTNRKYNCLDCNDSNTQLNSLQNQIKCFECGAISDIPQDYVLKENKAMKKPKKTIERKIRCKSCNYCFYDSTEEGKKAFKKIITKKANYPDMNGTNLIARIFKCPKCGGNIKDSGNETKRSLKGNSKKQLVNEKLDLKIIFSIKAVAKEIKSKPSFVNNLLASMIKKKQIEGKIINGFYYPK